MGPISFGPIYATGNRVDIKRIQVVNVFSGDARDGMSAVTNPRIDAIKEAFADAMSILYADMETGERRSVYQATIYLKREMGEERWQQAMRKARILKFVRAVELFTDEFQLTDGGYYLTKIE